MKLGSLKATTVRKVLFLGLFLVIALATGGFYLGLQTIRELAVSVTQTAEDATASGQQIEQLRALQTQLAQTRTLVEKADKISVPATGYQSQALNDLSKYAATAGITLTGTDFPQGDNSAEPVRRVKVGISKPVSYTKFLYFLELVESNLPNMQLEGISISRPDAPSADMVNVEDITIKVLTK